MSEAVSADAAIVAAVLQDHGVPDPLHTIRSREQFEDYMLEVAQRVRAALTEPVAATATDWEVTAFEDEAGAWRVLNVYDPAREAEQEVGEEEQVLAATILMSDVEAGELADQLRHPDRG